ncbi:thioredoxin family protein [Pyrodictium abyssi]|uniref:Thioredoxin family protein n=2 Tax=Pyrodictium abyssi TaxID=54256 RepID=A0ABN6ZPG7_9CREN|nr:thioredoxin family protein [Pyrodictium abyssi]
MMDPVRMEIDHETREAIREAFQDLVKPVTINVFIGPNCQYCDETLKIAKVLEEEAPAKNGEKLVKVRIYEKGKDDEIFKKHGVERIPTITLLDGMIRYTGTPSGEEIRGLVETIIRISQEDSGLDPETVEKIKEISEPVHVEVIVTPQCPYCPYAALLTNMFAFESWRHGKRNFIADTVEAYENPDIADKYNVMSVPAIAINGVLAFVGVPYEEDFIERIIDIVKRGRGVLGPKVISESATGV